MVFELKLRKIGNSVGIVLPKKILAQWKAGEGDKICLTTAADGSVRIIFKPELAKQMKVFKGIMRRYDTTLRELAK